MIEMIRNLSWGLTPWVPNLQWLELALLENSFASIEIHDAGWCVFIKTLRLHSQGAGGLNIPSAASAAHVVVEEVFPGSVTVPIFPR
jgi:hypothetical protein